MKYRIDIYRVPSKIQLDDAAEAVKKRLKESGINDPFPLYGNNVKKLIVDCQVGIHLRESNGLYMRVIRTKKRMPSYVYDILRFLGFDGKEFHLSYDLEVKATLDVLVRGG